jgi:anaerobic selenocysteine-containing dehydrogenase
VGKEYWFETTEDLWNYMLRKSGLTWKEFKERGYLARMGKDQVYYKYKTDYWRKGGGFRTKTGKVELYSTQLESLGYDPLPHFKEPNESPYATPDLAREYPLILSAGGRIPYYFHSQYRQLPWLRERQPWPIVQLNPDTANSLNIKDGDWVWIETTTGRVRQKCQLFSGMDPRIVSAQHGWWFPELPGEEPWLHGIWESNINVVTEDDPEHCNKISGGWPLSPLLCKVYKAKKY